MAIPSNPDNNTWYKSRGRTSLIPWDNSPSPSVNQKGNSSPLISVANIAWVNSCNNVRDKATWSFFVPTMLSILDHISWLSIICALDALYSVNCSLKSKRTAALVDILPCPFNTGSLEKWTLTYLPAKCWPPIFKYCKVSWLKSNPKYFLIKATYTGI